MLLIVAQSNGRPFPGVFFRTLHLGLGYIKWEIVSRFPSHGQTIQLEWNPGWIIYLKLYTTSRSFTRRQG